MLHYINLLFLLGTGQYLWEYGTGKFATGPPVILTLRSNGATDYFEGWLNGATDYFNALFQRGQRLFESSPIRGHGLFTRVQAVRDQ